MEKKLQTNFVFENEIKNRVKCNYLVYLPEEYGQNGKKFPLILFLHGVAERGSDIKLVKSKGLPAMIEKGRQFPFIIVSPQCPGDEWWNNDIIVRQMLKPLIDEIIRKYRVDQERVYLTGLSMGGFGTWHMAMTYPDMFAAAAPVCGGGIKYLAAKYNKLPIWAFHGEMDDVVPVERSREMVDAVNAEGGNARLTVYPGVGHNSWDRTYANDELYEWFLSHKRNKK